MSNFPKLFTSHYEYLLREVLETIDDAVVVFGHDHNIIYANAAADDVFGTGHGDLVGVGLDKLIPKDKLSHFKSIITKLQSSSHHEVQLQGKKEFVGMRAHDHYLYAEGKLAKFEDESAYVLVLRDITWRKALEGELETALGHLRKVSKKVVYQIEHPKILDEFPID
jgi:PAS domain S-box-containing protein